jgi:hypothetical protein
VIAQEKAWGTHLDIQYIRQLYQSYGWPQAFSRDKAFDAVDQMIDKLPEHRGKWEASEEDWDEDH